MSEWYALTVKPNLENSCTAALVSKGYETFLPTYQTERRWSDRIKRLARPLFPGYTFCWFDAGRRLPVLTTPGVMSIVGPGKWPSPVAESELEAVRSMVNSGLPVSPWPFLREGQRLRIVRGSLEGVDGYFVRHKQGCRLVVSVTLLQRSVAVDIDSDCVRPS